MSVKAFLDTFYTTYRICSSKVVKEEMSKAYKCSLLEVIM